MRKPRQCIFCTLLTRRQNDPCLRFSGHGSALCRSSWAWNFKSGCSKLRKKHKTSWADGRCRHWKWGKKHKTSIYIVYRQAAPCLMTYWIRCGRPSFSQWYKPWSATWQHYNIALKCHFYVWLWQCGTWFSTISTRSCGGWTWRQRFRGSLNQISQQVAEP